MTPAEIEAAIRLFDDTTGALASQVRRLEEVLTAKQAELVETNARLTEQVNERDRLTAWLNLIMGSIASGVVAVDLSGHVTTCNEAACSLLSGAVTDLIEAPYLSLFPDSPLLQVLATGKAAGPVERTAPSPTAMYPRGSSKGRLILRCRASPIRSPEGHLLGAVEVFDDVTELRTLEERAERADRLKQLGEMAAGVAHEIRNPLNGIEGFASLLARDVSGDGPEAVRQRRYANAIIDGVRHLNRAVSDLLEFTKPRRLERRPFDPVALLRETVALVEAEDRREDDATTPSSVRFEVTDRWDGQLLTADPGQLRQVLVNLLQNAKHALLEGEIPAPHIVASVQREADGSVSLLIEDNGPGVPDADRQRIFTPFFTTRSQGTGLGLAVSHTIATLHGGGISVDESPLGGARFRVSLPG
jgi:signal transduction histidine kinase